ncbi:MAG TPA: PIG-L family deacetylase [Vicinamibacterales bacterium]|nr:PIG-L family deacetylase [Vicinamibacterales bacterium]
MRTLHRSALAVVAVLAMTWRSPAVQITGPGEDGAAGAWQKILKLKTTASVMHTTAHPDDEHGGLLAMLSRGRGARVSMLTLTRGESGDNAIGPELFDALGLIRTEELRLANRYYGVDQQYFGTVADYGFSKRLDEALEKWGRDRVLRDIVAVIRTERPLVIISRFRGDERDGHGNHSAAGLLTREAFRLAGDAQAFPELTEAHLRPWQPLKLYMGGVRHNEDWTIEVNPGEYDPVLGESYHSLGRLGLSFQRSQTGGRPWPTPGPAISYYRRLQSLVEAPQKEMSFFDGIDTTLSGLYRTLRLEPPAEAASLLASVEREIQAAADAFELTDPSAAAPALARALSAVRSATARLGGEADVAHVLDLKERQLADALTASLGIMVTAYAQPADAPRPAGPFGGAPPAMDPVVPGQSFDVRVTFVSRGKHEIDGVGTVSVQCAAGCVQPSPGTLTPVHRNEPHVRDLRITVPTDAALTRPHFTRKSIQDASYEVLDRALAYRPAPAPAFEAVVTYAIGGVPVELRRAVTRLEPNLPYGYEPRELAVVPAVAVALSPEYAVVPLAAAARRSIRMEVDVQSNDPAGSAGTVALQVPPDWSVEPASHAFRFSRAGEKARHVFEVGIPSLDAATEKHGRTRNAAAEAYRVEAVARSGGREYRDGYTVLRHRDLETRYLYRPATSTVRGVDVEIAAGLRVGYVMGVGDDVPSALAQLGVEVELLGAQQLGTGDLSRFDAIMTGTRAYAVREDLKTHNRRLLDYAREGGNLIVLYNTPELVPAQYAPFPGELPANAEEVSEEDSPVEILAPDAAVLTSPNRITLADFENWVEQRGSKFWSSWNPRYTPILATWDTGQAPQRGGWLHATYGQGHYTYFAYALHRQLPYGVPGAYRLLANLLSLNRQTGSGPRGGPAPRP